jgi:hypothetical protein
LALQAAPHRIQRTITPMEVEPQGANALAIVVMLAGAFLATFGVLFLTFRLG